MPVTVTIDAARLRVDVRATGEVTYHDVVDLLAQRRSRGVFAYAVLVDFDSVTTRLTSHEVRALADARRSAYANAGTTTVGPTAVVADRDLLFGMLRMYQILTDDGPPLYIARTRAEAEAWLAERSQSTG